MRALLDCPQIECWQALFADALPADQRERYERHLESCPTCQDRLDHVEQCADAMRRLGRRVGDPTAAPADPALTQLLAQLRETKTYEPTDLYFLQPSDRPGVLGTPGDFEVGEVIGLGAFNQLRAGRNDKGNALGRRSSLS